MTHRIHTLRQPGFFTAILAFLALSTFTFSACNKVTNTGSTDDAARYIGVWNGTNLKGEPISITFNPGETGVLVQATIPVGNVGCERDTIIRGYANGNIINFPNQVLPDACDLNHMLNMYGTLAGYIKNEAAHTGTLTLKMTMGWLPGGQQTYTLTRSPKNMAARFVGLWKGTSTGSGLPTSITFGSGDNIESFSFPYVVGVDPCLNYVNVNCISEGNTFTIPSQDFNDGCDIPVATIYGDGSIDNDTLTFNLNVSGTPYTFKGIKY